jgi:carbonic anhydrase
MMTIENIRDQSPVLAEMEANNEIKIIGGMYNISNGEVIFFS